ncbi:hypothetical protein chiPu_0022790, partial [Chiloscyllium punctatum]|nr:hypothetical protein [Chiloscyllium punctatum]
MATHGSYFTGMPKLGSVGLDFRSTALSRAEWPDFGFLLPGQHQGSSDRRNRGRGQAGPGQSHRDKTGSPTGDQTVAAPPPPALSPAPHLPLPPHAPLPLPQTHHRRVTAFFEFAPHPVQVTGDPRVKDIRDVIPALRGQNREKEKLHLYSSSRILGNHLPGRESAREL